MPRLPWCWTHSNYHATPRALPRIGGASCSRVWRRAAAQRLVLREQRGHGVCISGDDAAHRKPDSDKTLWIKATTCKHPSCSNAWIGHPERSGKTLFGFFMASFNHTLRQA